MMNRPTGRRISSSVWAAAAFAAAVFAALPGGALADPPANPWIEIAKDRAVKSPLAAKRLLLGVAQAGERLVAVGEFGHILLSDDRGRTWRQAASVPTNITLTAVSFADASHGWAVGHDAIILHTEDGGETWQPQFADEETGNPLLSVAAFGRDRAIAVGAFARMLETRDGGKTWTPRTIVPSSEGEPTENHLNGIFRGPGGMVFVAAEFGAVFRSEDDGASFTLVASGYEGSFWGGMSLRDGGLLVFGMRGNVWRSDDQGLTWVRLQSNLLQSIGGGTELADGTVVLAGLSGTVLHSHDDGRSFTVVTRPDRKGLATVAPGGGNEVNLFGEAGVVRHTVPARRR